MAKLPSPEESSRAILAIFKVMGFRAGGTLQKDQVKMQYAVNAGIAENFDSGLKYAVDQGWFKLPSTSTITLTNAGFAEIQKR